ncbi:Aldo/keto reductase family protein [compost metagenome]
MARRVEKTPAQTALNWLLGKEGIVSPIFGASTLAQFEDNMGATGWELPRELWDKLDQASALPQDYPDRFIEKFRRPLL